MIEAQDMTWRAEQAARIERELIARATPDLNALPVLGDCDDCNGHPDCPRDRVATGGEVSR